MLKTEISVFKDVKSTNSPYQQPVSYFLDRIKNGSKATPNIFEYRKSGDEKYKKLLPACTFSGTFSYRAKDKILKYSQFACLDFDKIGDITNLNAIKDNLIKDDCLFCCFISPSGKGIKAVFRTVNTPDQYESMYRALCAKYNDVHLDSKTRDISRLCFESYDPDIYINENAKEWDKCEEEDIHEVGKCIRDVTVPMRSENRIIDNLQTWFDKKYSMTSGQRNQSLYAFAAALNSFGINQMTAENHLRKYAESGFDEGEIKNTISSAYKRYTMEFGSRSFEDTETKQIIQKHINNGKTTKEIKKELEKNRNPITTDADVFDDILTRIKSNEDESVFWQYKQNGSINLIPHKYESYLRANSFFKFYPESTSDTFIFVKKDKNLLEETNNNKIKDFVLNDLHTRENVGYAPYDFMANNPKFFKTDFLNILNSVDIELKKDTAEYCYLYYRNSVVEVGVNSLKEIEYIDIDKYVWKNTVINRDFKLSDHHKSEFRSFLWFISGENQSSYNCFKSAIGYLLHSYKTTADNKAIILNDEVISDTPNGRSGKGLFFNAIKQLKKLVSINGKNFTFEKNFAFQTVTTDCQVLVFDDVKKNFNFEDLFSIITEGLEIEYKNQGAIKIPVEKSPKIVITTNYTIKGEGGSFDARKHELELASYFHKDYTPIDHFGHRLFDEWNTDEWARFDNFMIQCIQYYLKNGLKKQKHKNLELRKFMGETSNDFYEWVTNTDCIGIELNKRYNNNEIFNKFVEEYPDYKNKLQIKTLKKWIKTFCEFKDYDYSDGTSQGQRYFIITQKGDISKIDDDIFTDFKVIEKAPF